jgi:hypothetical protein
MWVDGVDVVDALDREWPTMVADLKALERLIEIRRGLGLPVPEGWLAHLPEIVRALSRIEQARDG